MLSPSALVEVALRILAPPQCAACDEALSVAAVFCPACARSVAPAETPSACALAAAAYGGAVAEAIVRLKYNGRTDLARPLAHLMAPLVPRLGRVDIVVPVPLHRARLRERGYNQAALLARPLARRLNVPLAPFALERARETAPQASLAADERARNVATAFRCRRPSDVAHKRVLLVDDVRTTGATLDACAAAADAAGALSVQFLTVAQT